LIRNALGRHTFSDKKTPWPFMPCNRFASDTFFRFFERFKDILEFSISYIYLYVLGSPVVAAILSLMHASWIRSHGALFVILYGIGIFLPLEILLVGGIVVFMFLLIRYYPLRGVCKVLASTFCRTELSYYKMHNQARIDAAVEKIIDGSYTPPSKSYSYCRRRDLEQLKKFSSEY
jgi:hypothetical protein